MWVFSAIGLFLCAPLWRVTGLPIFGRWLVNALGSRNENLRVLAGMFLTRSGRMAEPLLEEALHRGENLPTVMMVLATIGDKRAEPEIRLFSGHHDPLVAEAAAQALRVLTSQR
jgi:hypothetical protein